MEIMPKDPKTNVAKRGVFVNAFILEIVIKFFYVFIYFLTTCFIFNKNNFEELR